MAKKKLPSTQQFLPIAQIRENVVVMRDGTLRKVVLVSAINFSLKGQDEQRAIVEAYVRFLNSNDFPLQIMVQSRRMDIGPYLKTLDGLAAQQTNELLKTQTQEYRGYIADLVDMAEIMEKRFYVVVPYFHYANKKKNFFARFNDVLFEGKAIKLKESKFRKYAEGLERRTSGVIGGLTSMGLNAVPLDTPSLIELFYRTYNPHKEPPATLANLGQMQVEQG